MSEFFMGLNPRWQMYKFLPQGLNMMFSTAGYCDYDDFGNWVGWRQPYKKFPKKAGRRFLDSGGYSLLNKHGEYPFSVENYANLQAALGADFFASMDLPCEPDISRALGLLSNKDRIAATVQNALDLIDLDGMVPGQVVPVIQGYTLDEYAYCIDLYKKAGAVRDFMAVGSMCRRISSEEILELIPGIYDYAANCGVKKLHFFGLKLSPDLIPVAKYIHSRDSAVALDSYDPKLRAKRDGRRWPKGQKEKEEVFTSFLGRLDDLGLNYIHKRQIARGRLWNIDAYVRRV